ncbi:MAG TPA: FGGY family carbohydrate kinase, partial [Solirubrobacteraceae bacterium]|nr:FGGY family carbohydrate kinase [Solirubrobacteraceae bacterium]
MSHDDVWIGLDVGTQSARAFAVTGDGQVAGSAGVALHGRRDGDRHEQDPRDWWAAVAAASRAALDAVAPERVRGVATCATSGTMLLVDGDGEPLTAGLMYDDGRAGEQAARLSEALGVALSASWALPKLVWLIEAQPTLMRGARLAHQADVVTRALAGHDMPSDSSHALKSGYDQLRECWPALGVADELLPPVVRSGTRVGEVCTRAAAETGIPAGTPIVAGMTDGCAAQLAAGALREGDWNSVLGTTLVLKGYGRERVDDRSGVLYSHRAPDGGWMPGGASSSGAGVLSAEFPDRDLDELGRRAAAFDGTSVLAYPLVSRGERFPFAAAGAEAFCVGEPACEAERFAALLQGVAFVERLCLDYVDLLGAPTGGQLTLTGGATRSRAWCALRADVLGRPVRLVEQPQAAVGMAVLAAASVGGEGLRAAADAIVRTREVVAPRGDRAAGLLESYARLLAELERRGWLGRSLARHARTRAGGG